VKALAAALGATALLGGAAHAASPGSVIVFAADRMPSVAGDVYRVDANGHVANLTHSPWQDTQPLVSPDGKRVAFVSDRGGGGGLWVVGVDGSGLRHLAAAGLPSQYEVGMAWSPDGRELAYTTGGSAHGPKLWLVSLGSTPRKIASSKELAWPSWSPDGRLLTVFDGGALDAFTASGRRAWSVTSGGGPIGWSARGLLATGIYDGATHVVDERGRQRFVAPADTVAWSANGGMLATVKGRRLEVRATSGAVVLQMKLPFPNYGLHWVTADAVAFDGANGVDHRVAIPSGRVTPFDLSAFGLNTVRTGSTFAVRDRTRVYTHVPGCFDDGGPNAGIARLQRVPHSTSLVYQSYCPEAFSNLYAVLPNGTGLRRLTNAQENQLEPAISPDGTRIAYAQSDAVGLSCKGCPQSLHVMNVDGSGDVTLTSPPDCTFDDSPSWSPDGTTIMFVDSACNIAPHALTIAAGGGPTTDVHIPAWTLAWGPKRVAYASGATAPSSMWTSLADGTDRQRIAGIGAGLTSPAWSADGRLAYLEGTTAVVQGKRVPLPFVQVRTLAWSPDGTHLVVVAKAAGTASFDVYTLRTDGTDLRRITRNIDASSADWR
jgi:Tol biopolymer transport system component